MCTNASLPFACSLPLLLWPLIAPIFHFFVIFWADACDEKNNIEQHRRDVLLAARKLIIIRRNNALKRLILKDKFKFLHLFGSLRGEITSLKNKRTDRLRLRPCFLVIKFWITSFPLLSKVSC